MADGRYNNTKGSEQRTMETWVPKDNGGFSRYEITHYHFSWSPQEKDL